MSASTLRRRQILNFIRSYTEAEGRPPSLEEIAAACGLKARSAARKHVKALEESGELEVAPKKARGARPKQRKTSAPGSAPLFEVSVQDVAALQDADLRELVARLYMAGLAELDLPPVHVMWGGDQRAPDGGIDVRVQLPCGTKTSAWFPRSATGIQVKATKMAPADIHREMCPGGLLRPSIQEIIRAEGSYIIATSDSVADEEYGKRVAAIRSAAATEAGSEKAVFDYYDARRLADWTNQHPGVVAWVRTRLGRPLQGWRPYGQWADTRGGKPQPFLPDEKQRLADRLEPDRKFPLAEGLAQVRNILRVGGSSVRLAGLSGVGKTRFAQALFEAEAAPDPLPAELAVYTDTSHSPNPPPLALLDELLVSGRRAILVIDNCGSQLHDQLTSRCKASNCVSLITIEYDIRDGLPSETSVFRLETGSADLVEKVLKQQFPHISQVSAATITKFADGNSRVAIALANTVGRNESLAGLNDTELFNRLFWQGKEAQQELKVAAQACALVYSFDGEDLDGELGKLAALAEMSGQTLYRHVADLEVRGLAQRRGVWRAVLPHAVANTLAARALEAIPEPLIVRYLVRDRGRLLRSFSRRLGYLHDSPQATAIVRKWLSSGGLIGDLTALTPLLIEVFSSIAPVDPGAALEGIERAVNGPESEKFLASENQERTRIVRLVRSIAYEARYFDRCMEVLLKFALAEPADNRTDATHEVISSLFHLYLSGTYAGTDQRASWVRKLLESTNPEIEALGHSCLSAALECHHFSSLYGFEFGARARDYGWAPRGEEARPWFAAFIGLAAEVGRMGTPTANAIRELLARHFRSLWAVAAMVDELEAATISLLESGWEKGWLAIRQTLRFDGKALAPDVLSRLKALEDRAKPRTLVARVKALVLNGHSSGVDFADGESASTGYERADQLARELGELVAGDADAFAAVLPLVVANEQGRQWTFGEGIATGADNVESFWIALVSAFEAAPEAERNVQVLRGFLRGVYKRDRALLERFLDEAMDRPALAKWLPVLQLSAPLDESGCARLLASMDNPAVPAWVYQYLGHGRATEGLADDVLAQLLRRLSIKPEGIAVAVDVLSMHIFDNPNPVGPQVVQMARSLLAVAPLERHNFQIDHAVGRLIEFFLKGEDGEAAARRLLESVRSGLEDYTLSRYTLTDTLGALCKVQPKAALDILVGDEDDYGDVYIRRRALAGGRRSSALSQVSIEDLVAWCEAGKPERWAYVAPLVPAFAARGNEERTVWSDKALALLKRAPRPLEVAQGLVELIEPTSWSGSRAEAIKARLPLLDDIELALGPGHEEQVAVWRSRIAKTMEHEARRELEEHRASNERFE